MASKFELQFRRNNKEIYATRGEMISKQMDNSLSMFKKELEMKEFDLRMAIEDMMDFGKTNTTSLDIKRPDSYSDFISQLHNKKKQLELVRLDIRILKELEEEYFSDITNDTIVKGGKDEEEN